MAKHHVSTTVNGDAVEFLCETEQTLLDCLRDELELTGAKEGCSSGDCGACSVMIDSRLVCSCLVLGVEANGKSIETIEGMAERRAAASAAAEVPGACRPAVRHLHAGVPRRVQGAAGEEPQSDRDGGPLLAGRQSVPVHGLRQDRQGRHGRGHRDERSLTHARAREEGPRARVSCRRHPAYPSRWRRQGDGPRQVRRRPQDGRPACRQGAALAACACAHQEHRRVEGGGPAGRQGHRHAR